MFRIKSGEIRRITKEAWDAKHKRTGDYKQHKPLSDKDDRIKAFADRSQGEWRILRVGGQVAGVSEGRARGERMTENGTRAAGRCDSDW